MINIQAVLRSLAHKRPVFHSEADFQHALAWEIHERSPACSIRLEQKPPHLKSRFYLDVWVEINGAVFALELKYKTKVLNVEFNNEDFELLNQGAQDLGRYDFLKDIQRLEQVVSGRNEITGYAILLTNDGTYWNTPGNRQTVDAAFRIHQGRTINGELKWDAGTGEGTMRGRKDPIVIKGHYTSSWEGYSELSNAPSSEFRYIMVKVEDPSKA